MALRADAALLEVGWSIWSTTRRTVYGDPIGGVICQIDAVDELDAETGEVTTRTMYRCRDPYDNDITRWELLDGAEIDPALAEPPTGARVGRLIRRMCWQLGKASRRQTLTHTEHALLDDVARLRPVVA